MFRSLILLVVIAAAMAESTRFLRNVFDKPEKKTKPLRDTVDYESIGRMERIPFEGKMKGKGKGKGKAKDIFPKMKLGPKDIFVRDHEPKEMKMKAKGKMMPKDTELDITDTMISELIKSRMDYLVDVKGMDRNLLEDIIDEDTEEATDNRQLYVLLDNDLGYDGLGFGYGGGGLGLWSDEEDIDSVEEYEVDAESADARVLHARGYGWGGYNNRRYNSPWGWNRSNRPRRNRRYRRGWDVEADDVEADARRLADSESVEEYEVDVDKRRSLKHGGKGKGKGWGKEFGPKGFGPKGFGPKGFGPKGFSPKGYIYEEEDVSEEEDATSRRSLKGGHGGKGGGKGWGKGWSLDEESLDEESLDEDAVARRSLKHGGKGKGWGKGFGFPKQ